MSPLGGGSFTTHDLSGPGGIPSQITGSFIPGAPAQPSGSFMPSGVPAPFSQPMNGFGQPPSYLTPSERGGFAPTNRTPGPQPLPQTSLADEETVMLSPHRSITLWLVIGALILVVLGAGGFLLFSLIVR